MTNHDNRDQRIQHLRNLVQRVVSILHSHGQWSRLEAHLRHELALDAARAATTSPRKTKARAAKPAGRALHPETVRQQLAKPCKPVGRSRKSSHEQQPVPPWRQKSVDAGAVTRRVASADARDAGTVTRKSRTSGASRKKMSKRGRGFKRKTVTPPQVCTATSKGIVHAATCPSYAKSTRRKGVRKRKNMVHVYTFAEVRVAALPNSQWFTAGVNYPNSSRLHLLATGNSKDNAVRALRDLLTESDVPFDFSDWKLDS